MNIHDIKTCVILIPYVFGDTSPLSTSEQLRYIQDNYNEILETLPMEDMQKISDLFVKEAEDEVLEEEKRLERINKVVRKKSNKPVVKKPTERLLKNIVSVDTNKEVIEVMLKIDYATNKRFGFMDDYGIYYICRYIEHNGKIYGQVEDKHNTLEGFENKEYNSDEFNCINKRAYEINEDFILEAHKRIINTTHSGIITMLIGCIEGE